jgi:NAD(P)-dependent dehydrogenase (short-subunit alcohol dehydrogenase family)
MPTFNPNKDIPDLANKVILITGGTAGLGAESVATLARHNPGQIFFTGRNQKTADALIDRVKKISPNVKVTFLKSDISSFASIKEMVAAFNSQSDRLDILMLNAGVMALDASVSADGYEIQFATNHLGHALLVKLLLPTLQATKRLPDVKDVRIVNLTSQAYQLAPSQGIDFATLKSPQPNLGGLMTLGGKWARYGQSKLAQLLYSQELARHYPDVTSVSVHPGYIKTGLFDAVSFTTALPVLLVGMGRWVPVEQGFWTQCWAATTAKENLVNGEYYEPVGVMGKRTSKLAKDEGGVLGKKLWEWTDKALSAWV